MTAQYCGQPNENTQYESIASDFIENCAGTVEMTVTLNATFNGDNHYVIIYVDKDQDGTSYEAVYNLGVITYNGTPSVFQFSATDFTVNGTYDYRIIMAYDAPPTGPCNDLPTASDWGDVQDGQFAFTTANALYANPNNATTCQGEVVNIGNNATGGLAPYSYNWSIIGGTSTGATLSNTTNSVVSLDATSASVGSVDLQLEVTDANGCTNTETSLVDIGEPVSVDAGADDNVCDSDYMLNGTISGSVVTGTWSGGGGTFSPNAQTLNALYSPTSAEFANGSVTLTLTSDNPIGGCTYASDDVTITLFQPASANAGSDQSFGGLQAVDLSATSSGTGTWSGGLGSFANATNPSTTYTPDPTEDVSIVTLTWTTNDPDGAGECTAASDDLFIYFGVGDNDNDGVLDGSDLDDDNDGILDVDEIQCAGPPSAFIFNGYANDTYPPDLNPVTINGIDLSFNQVDLEGALTYTGVIDLYPGDKHWRWLQDLATQTSFTDGAIGFSEPVAGVVLRLADVDSSNDPFGFVDSVTVNAWTDGSVVEIRPSMITVGSAVKYNPGSNTFVGILLNNDNETNGDVIIDFSNEAIDSIAFRYQNNSTQPNPPQQAIGIYGFDFCPIIDSDGDGEPDYRDTDSDNDGCFDAVEGAGSIVVGNLNVDGMIAGGVDSDGVPLLLTGGQGIGDSQNPAVQDPDCTVDCSSISASVSTTTICAGNDVVIAGNPSGGSGNYTIHSWTVDSGTTATGVTLSNEDTESVTLSADQQGSVHLTYTVTDNAGCTVSSSTIVNVLYSPLCTVEGPTLLCSPSGITIEYVPTEFEAFPSTGSVNSGTQGQLETHVFDGVTSPDDVTLVLTLPTWDDSFFETTLNGNVIFPENSEPQSWGTGGLEINAPWSANVNGLPRTIITFTSTSVTYQVSQNVNSTTMTTVVPTNWVTTPQPFQIGQNTFVFGIKNTAGPTSGTWSLEGFQDYNVSYLWSTGSTAPSIDVTPTTTTTYQLTVTNSSGCSRVCSHTVNVGGAGSDAVDQTLCTGQTYDIDGLPTGSGSYLNHQWSEVSSTADGVVLYNTDEQVLTLNAANASAGTIELRYTAEDSNATDPACATIDNTITITLGPEVTFVGPGILCEDAGTQTLSASPTGGTFSGTGVSGNSFDPASAGVGSHIVTYTFTDGNGCTVSKSDNIIIDALPCGSSTCTDLDSEDFESGWGIWNDGGGDCTRRPQNANSGAWSIRLRDNSGAASSMTTDPIDMSTYDEAIIDFSYYVNSFDDANEDFFLEISLNGGGFTQVEEWNLGDEFVNNQRYNESVTVTGYTLDANTRFRFRADASENGDQVYIDDVRIQGCINVPTPDPCALVSFVGSLTYSGLEDDLGDFDIHLEIPAPLSTDLSISYSANDVQALLGTDYQISSSAIAVIPAGATTTAAAGGTPIEVQVGTDSDIENDEDFEIIFHSSSVVCVNPDSILMVTIINDDSSAPILTNIENDNMLYCPASGTSTEITQTITIADPPSGNLSATVTITGTTDPAEDTLSIDLTSYPQATATYTYPTLTISGTISPPEMQDILRSIEFKTSSETMGVRSIEFVINDGSTNSNTATRNINSDENDVGCCNAVAPSIGK